MRVREAAEATPGELVDLLGPGLVARGDHVAAAELDPVRKGVRTALIQLLRRDGVGGPPVQGGGQKRGPHDMAPQAGSPAQREKLF